MLRTGHDTEEDLDDELDPLIFDAVPAGKEVASVDSHSPATHHAYNEDALRTYIYPTNLQIRDYQYNIVNRALYHNVLVALPTGLGKTFIASTVMLNFLRWFPQLKLIFMAPTKPLVAQQIKACCGITGIPSSDVAILLDKTRRNRAAIWDEKRVFFTTPQVVENDLTSGIVDPKLVVLLVIDEAHRAKGNYAYNNVVKFLTRFNRSFRILALTATPASDVSGVQEIVDNLHISKVEVRTERSIDIYKYLKKKTIERITVGQSDEIRDAIDLICEAIGPILETANQRKIYEITDPARINAFTALDAQQKLVRNPNVPEGLKWANYFILQLLVVVGQCLRRLNIYGIRSFYSYFKEKHNEFSTKFNNKKSKNALAAKFFFHPSISKLLSNSEKLISDPKFLGHQKLEVLMSNLSDFFENTTNTDSRVIIFTEFRESALDIVRAIELLGEHLKPHIFIGQAKEREKFDEEKFLKKGKKSKAGEKKEAKAKETTPVGERPSSSELAQMNGLNQKKQKELIKKFKSGEYNVLVATSIGEEGLDIGEVDLIVCYDSTSSPIKNIQRMGRTGRNRDGKVLLLFSSNEELKFDKAMGGYEYIQQHIMSGNLILVCDQNRIIPKDFLPAVQEQFIEIPEENAEFKQEEDEDEIIKLATKYMTGAKGSKKSGSKKLAKPKKIEKRFFMPDDVETGFQLVSDMLKEPSQKKRQPEERPRDVLDTILDSDGEQVVPLILEAPPSKRARSEPAEDAKPLQVGKRLGTQRRPIQQVQSPSTPVVKRATKVSRQPEITNWKSITVLRDSPPAAKQDISTPNQVSAAIDDDFDDDDDDILALAKQASSFIAPVESELSQKEKVFEVSETEGFLTAEQKSELYMGYYMPTDASSLLDCYVPLSHRQDNGQIPHSSTSKSFLNFQRFVANPVIQEPSEHRSTVPKDSALDDFVVFD